MKTLERLQESYEKELDLAKRHKKRAEELKQKIDEQKTLSLQRKMNELHLSFNEYEKFLVFVSDKDSVMSVISPEEAEDATGCPAVQNVQEKEEEEEMKAIEQV